MNKVAKSRRNLLKIMELKFNSRLRKNRNPISRTMLIHSNTPALLTGISSAFNLYGPFYKFRFSDNINDDILRAQRQDWIDVGADLKRAMHG